MQENYIIIVSVMENFPDLYRTTGITRTIFEGVISGFIDVIRQSDLKTLCNIPGTNEFVWENIHDWESNY